VFHIFANTIGQKMLVVLLGAVNYEAVMTEWNATKAQAATRLLELIEMRLISESIHVTAALGSGPDQRRHQKR
jgi:ABC-type siderophore export system fused ATPase/permease subunit